MKQIDLNRLKDIQLEILEAVHSFCISNNIHYSLGYGTLLGAVRHKGYIPWDDDIDIIMPRPDYDKFLKLFQSDKYTAIDLSRLDSCVEMFIKVYKNGTIMEDLHFYRSLFGVNIDIFPMDGVVGTENKDRINYIKNVIKKLNRLALVCPFYKSSTKKKNLFFMKYLTKRLLFLPLKNELAMKRDLLSLVKERTYDECDYVCNLLAVEGTNELCDKEMFDNYIDIEFENRKFKSISKYDEYLTNLYGNYMEFPPVHERVTKHLYNAYILEK